MIGIKDIASYIPPETIDNIKQGESFGESADFMLKKIGALALPRMASEQDASDMAVLAVKALQKKNQDFDIDKIDALIVVTQNGDHNGLPHTSAIVQDKLNMRSSVAAFDISLGCSGYVYGLFVLQGFMQVSDFKNALLITSDPYSKIVDTTNRVTSLLFGDAATATWLSDKPKLRMEFVRYGTDGSGADNLIKDNNVLSMNGRQVFNFASTTVVKSIKEFLALHNIMPEDVDCYCMHQGSAAVVDAISRQFSHVRDRFVNDIKETGNTVSSSIPLHLEKLIDRGFSGKRILISGFGVGLSWATATLVNDAV